MSEPQHHHPGHEELMRHLAGQTTPVRVVEDIIPIGVQERFLKLAKRIHPNKFSDAEALELIGTLTLKDIKTPEIQKIIVILAFRGNIEAYRSLESYLPEAPAEVQDFVRFGLQVSRLMVESELSDQVPSLISTGLGGKGDKIRYILAVFPSHRLTFGETQEKIIRNEWDEACRKAGIETERIRFFLEYSSFSILAPIQTELNGVVRSFIEECNQYGDFIYRGYFLTNVAIPDHRELLKYRDKILRGTDENIDSSVSGT